jgi:hypothetical protein
LKRAGVGACAHRLLGKMVPVLGAVGGAITSAWDMRRSAERALAQLEASPRASSPLIAASGVAHHVDVAPAPEHRSPAVRPTSSARRAALVVAVAAIRAGDAMTATARQLRAEATRSRAARFTASHGATRPHDAAARADVSRVRATPPEAGGERGRVAIRRAGLSSWRRREAESDRLAKAG